MLWIDISKEDVSDEVVRPDTVMVAMFSGAVVIENVQEIKPEIFEIAAQFGAVESVWV